AQPRVVTKMHDDRVADPGMQNGPQNAEVALLGRARFERAKRAISVFSINGLQIAPSDPVTSLLEINGLLGAKRLLHNWVIRVGGRVVPHHLVGGDIIESVGS